MSPGENISGLHIAPGVVIAGRFEVQERIGSGGMGMVYKALDRELNNDVVALKLLLPHLAQDEQAFRRFLNEVRVARSLSHPNIVRIHDIGKAEGGSHYISMEYVEGTSLRDRINDGSDEDTAPKYSPLTFENKLTILYKILTGVAYAHEKGIIHRDLKPANVLLGNNNEVKLADFGTARIVGIRTSLTQTGQMIGTPDYMSPEQVRGEPLDASCDIYALGIIAYEVAVGKCPFPADTPVAVAYKHLSEPIPNFADERAGIPAWYEAIVKRAAAKNKEERFSSAYEFAAAIAEHVPYLGQGTGFFRGDSFTRGPTGTVKGDAARREQDTRFELGKMGASEGSSAGWKLGQAEQQIIKPVLAEEEKRVSYKVTVVLLILLLLLGGAYYYFFVSGGANEGILIASESSSSISQDISSRDEAKLTEELLAGLDKKPTKSTQASSSSPQKVPAAQSSSVALASILPPSSSRRAVTSEASIREDRDSSSGPHMGDVEAGVPPVESRNSPVEEEIPSSSLPSVATAAETSLSSSPPAVLPSLQFSLSSVSSLGDSSLSSSLVASSTTTVAPLSSSISSSSSSAETLPAVAPTAATVVLTDFNLTSRAHFLTPGILPTVGWTATFKGIDDGDQLLKEISVTVVAAGPQRLVARLAPGRYLKSAEGVKVLGDLGDLRTMGIEPGEYRLSLIKDGRLLASKIFVVKEPERVIPTLQVGSASSERSLPAQAIPAWGASSAAPSAGLPPPTGLESSAPVPELNDRFAHRSAPPVEQTSPVLEPEVESSSAVSATNDSYSGFVTLPASSGEKIKHPIQLELIVGSSDIRGKAKIDELGDFEVQGRVLTRGVELTLRGSSVVIRLTGARKDSVFRGSLVTSSEQGLGFWEVRKN